MKFSTRVYMNVIDKDGNPGVISMHRDAYDRMTAFFAEIRRNKEREEEIRRHQRRFRIHKARLRARA